MEYQRYTKKRRQPRPPVAPAPTIWQTILAPRHRKMLVLAALLGGAGLTTLLLRSNDPELSVPARTAPVATVSRPHRPSQAEAPFFVSIEPVPAVPGARLRAVVTSTAVQTEIGSLAYRWQRNGQPLDFVSGSELDTAEFAKGDRIVVQVTPASGNGDGPMVESVEIVLQNRPPMITLDSFGTFAQGQYTNRISATDPDHDPLTFSLATAPEGMTIDPGTGTIEWPLPSDAQGTFHYIVVVSDGESSGSQPYTLTLDRPQ